MNDVEKSVQNKVEMREKWIVKVSHPSNVTLHKIIEIQLFLSKKHSQMLGIVANCCGIVCTLYEFTPLSRSSIL
jgi:hypothetical protein